MEISHLDDKMELGTSPYPHMDDIDFDFETDRQPSMDRSMADDDVDTSDANLARIRPEDEGTYNVDDMFEDDTIQPRDDDDIAEDLNMDSYEGLLDEEHRDADEDILYDEEAGSVDMNREQDTKLPEDRADFSGATNPDASQVGENQTQLSTGILSNTNQTVDTGFSKNASANGSAPDPTQVQTQISYEPHDPSANIFNAVAHNGIDNVVEGTADNVGSSEAGTSGENTLSMSIPSEKVNTGAEFQPHQDPSSLAMEAADKALGLNDDRENSVTKENATSGSDHDNQENPSSVGESLHPITIMYLDQEMSLFPPQVGDASATFFLSDSALAYEPIEKLLESCRDILGETLEHDDELVLDIPTLGLHICEDSKYASQISLSQVVDVYLTLSRNESLESIEPLYCSLGSRVCLASQYAYLAASASEGKTYSEIAADYVHSPDQEGLLNHEQDESGEVYNEKPDVNVDVFRQDSAEDSQSRILQSDLDEGVQVEYKDSDQLLTQNAGEGSSSTVTDFSSHVQGVESNRGNDYEADINANSTEESSHFQTSVIENSEAEGSVSLETKAVSEDEANPNQGLLRSEEYEDTVALEVNDNESVSSHTVEGEDENQYVMPAQNAQPNDHVVIHDSDLNVNASSGYGAILDLEEELVNEDNAHNTKNGTVPEASAESIEQEKDQHYDENSKIEETAEAEEEIDYEDFANDHEHNPNVPVTDAVDELEFLNNEREDLAGLLTPSRIVAGKRKAAVDEDDFDFLDISTPEPKRTRAS